MTAPSDPSPRPRGERRERRTSGAEGEGPAPRSAPQSMLSSPPMPTTSADIAALVEAELAGLTDHRIVAQIRALLVTPYAVNRPWSYGPPASYPCWTVLEHPASGTGIAYCEHGFGPDHLWGLVWLPADAHMGQDSQWFPTLLAAFLDSRAAPPT